MDHCYDPGCYSRKIVYDAPMEQIKALIQLSNGCSQDIEYQCFLSVLQNNGVDFGYWLDRNGDSQIYWTGANYGQHLCSCHFTEKGCYDEETEGMVTLVVEFLNGGCKNQWLFAQKTTY